MTELILAQLMWLDYDNPAKPVYVYINSSGTQVSVKIIVLKFLLVMYNMWLFI